MDDSYYPKSCFWLCDILSPGPERLSAENTGIPMLPCMIKELSFDTCAITYSLFKKKFSSVEAGSWTGFVGRYLGHYCSIQTRTRQSTLTLQILHSIPCFILSCFGQKGKKKLHATKTKMTHAHEYIEKLFSELKAGHLVIQGRRRVHAYVLQWSIPVAGYMWIAQKKPFQTTELLFWISVQ